MFITTYLGIDPREQRFFVNQMELLNPSADCIHDFRLEIERLQPNEFRITVIERGHNSLKGEIWSRRAPEIVSADGWDVLAKQVRTLLNCW